jgi:hypothetical protein
MGTIKFSSHQITVKLKWVALLLPLAHKLGRAVYFMLKNKTVFDDERFLKP